MANTVETEIVFDPVLGATSVKKLISKAKDVGEDVGEAAGKGASKEFRSEFNSGIKSGLKSLAATALATGTAIATALFSKRAIEASARQQTAINNLEASLARIGEFSSETSRDLQDFASELQKVSTIGDEAAIEQLAFAQGLGATAEQSKKIVSAAADLSAALNIDLNSATRNVARTLGGFAGELGEVIPELKNLTAEQLRSGAAIDLLAGKFQGLATAQINTFDGSIAQLQNTFGDLLESVGDFITKSPEITASIKFITSEIARATKGIQSLGESGLAKTIVSNLIQVGLGVNDFVIRPLITLKRIGELVFDSIVVGGKAIVAGFGQIAGAGAKLLELFGQGGGVSEALTNFKEATNEVFVDGAEDLNESIGKIFDPQEFANSSEEFLTNLSNTVNQAKPLTEALKNNTKSDLGETAKSVKKASTNIFNSLKNGLVGGLSNSIQKLATNLAQGKSLFDDFGKFILGTIGDMAIQVGNATLATGLALKSFGDLTGTSALIAGAGLIAVGSLLKALSGGSGGTGAAASPAGATAAGGAQAGAESAITEEPEEREEPDTRVNLVVNGNINGTEEEAKRLVDILNEGFDKQGLVLRTA